MSRAVGLTVTVELGEWSQTWTVPAVDERHFLDDETDELVTLVNAEGCVLDGLTASWGSSGGLFGTPEPTEAAFDVYVPLAASSRPDLAGAARIIMTPPGWDPAEALEYPPLFELEGKVTAGDARTLRDGLAYSVRVTDPTAALGEINLGGTGFPGEHIAKRMHRIATTLRANGFDWDVAGLPDGSMGVTGIGTGTDGLTNVNYDAEGWDDYSAGPFTFYAWTKPGLDLEPWLPVAAAESRPAAEVLDDHLRALTRWYQAAVLEPNDNVMWEISNWDDEFDAPPAMHALTFPMRPIVVWARAYTRPEEGARYRTAWVSIRVDGQGGLPLRFDPVAGAAVVRAEAEGALPEAVNAAWLPASAIDRDIVWRVDKARHPNAVRLTGWFQDWSDPEARGWVRSRLDKAIEHPESVERFGRVEEQHDLKYLHDPDEPSTIASPNRGNYIANALLGFEVDSQPRYAVEQITILPERIADGRAWPRLFQQLDIARPSASLLNLDADMPVFANNAALGRLLFVHGIRPEWHPDGRAHEYGQLVGASLSLTGGQLRLTADLVQRRCGPNGPWLTLAQTLSQADQTPPSIASWHQLKTDQAGALADGVGWLAVGSSTVSTSTEHRADGDAAGSAAVTFPAGAIGNGARTPALTATAGESIVAEVWVLCDRTDFPRVAVSLTGTGLTGTGRASTTLTREAQLPGSAYGWQRFVVFGTATVDTADVRVQVSTAGVAPATAGTMWLSELRVSSDPLPLTWEDLDPSLTAVDLWLTAAPAE